MLKTDLMPTSAIEDKEASVARRLDAESYNRKSVYNFFGFKPVHTELSHAPVGITGTLPRDLVGVYLRNGTNPQFDPSGVRYHMFDGAGMLHQIQIRDGGATYSNTYIRTPRFQLERSTGREIYLNVGEMVSGGKACLDKIKLIEEKTARGMIPALGLDGTQNQTAVQYHHGRIFCLCEFGYPFALDARMDGGELILDGTGGFETWGGTLRGAFSAHPAIDPESGDFYSITVSMANGTVDAAHVSRGDLRRSTAIHRQGASRGKTAWIHECVLTESFLVFPDVSMRFDEKAILGPEGSFFFFDRGHKMRWGVIPRDFDANTEVRWFETETPGTIWHLVNAWERKRADGGTDIVVYAPRFDWYPSDIPIHTPATSPNGF